jgi:glycosyltransferase involved in cell wall biosynthesis
MRPSEHGAKILFVASGLEVGGGAELQLSLLVPAVREAGFDASLLTLVEEGLLFDRLLRRGVPASSVRMRHRTDFVRLRRALGYARVRPDLVVSQSINAVVVGDRIAGKVHAPQVVIHHGGRGLAVAMHRRALARLVAPRIDWSIAVSRSQIPILVSLGYRADRISVIQNAVPELTPARPASSVRAELGVPAGSFLAVLVASLRPEKSIDVFIGGVQEARRRDRRIVGLVVGDGSERARLEQLASDDGAVRLTGQRVDVPDILGAADAVCLSSSADASPMALLEAMAVGKPVIATDVGGIPEAVVDEQTGLLVPAGNPAAFATALLRLARDQALAERMGRAARERHRTHFSVERMVAEYVDVFKRVLEARRAHRTA